MLPSVAYRVNPELSVGASLNAMYGMLRMQVVVNDSVGADGELAADSNKWGVGANLGILYEPTKDTRLGITWTSALPPGLQRACEILGSLGADAGPARNRGLLDADLKMGINVPQGVNASVFHQLDREWALLGSVGWQQWSTFGIVEIGVDDLGELHSLTKNLSFKDTWHGAFGAQYRPDPDVAHRPRICVRLRVPGQRERLAACPPTTSGASAWARTSRRARRTSAGESHSNTPTAARCR